MYLLHKDTIQDVDLLCCRAKSSLKSFQRWGSGAVLRWTAVSGLEQSITMLIYRPRLYTYFIQDSEYSARFNFTAKLRDMFVLLQGKYIFYLAFNPILPDTITGNFTIPEYWIWKTFKVESPVSTVNLPIVFHFSNFFWKTCTLCCFFLVLDSELCAMEFHRKSKSDLFLLNEELQLKIFKINILFLCLFS